MKGIIFSGIFVVLTGLQSNANNICSNCVKLDHIFSVNLEKKAYCTLPGAKVPGYVQFQAKSPIQCANLETVLRKFAIRTLQMGSIQATKQPILLPPVSTPSAKIIINGVEDVLKGNNNVPTSGTSLLDYPTTPATEILLGHTATPINLALLPIIITTFATKMDTATTEPSTSTDLTITSVSRNAPASPPAFKKLPLTSISELEQATRSVIFTVATTISTETKLSPVTKQTKPEIYAIRKQEETQEKQHLATDALVMSTRNSTELAEKERKLWRAMYRTFSLIKSLTALNRTSKAMENFNNMNPYSFFTEPKKIMKLLTRFV